jgi:CreA protein
MRKLACVLAAFSLLAAQAANADGGERIGTVDTTFKLLGRNDRIAVDRYDDPLVDGVSCYVSRAETGGVKGSLGVARDPSRYSIACRATGPVHVHEPLPKNQIVFSERASFFFKSVRVTRMYDAEKHVLLYVVWSTETLTPEGSPYNSITAVPLDR